MVSKMDVNGDGMISFTEFLSATYDRQKLLSAENVKLAFNLLDRDQKGQITK
jgi:Ca2+-binding EF-hand superfamily protein